MPTTSTPQAGATKGPWTYIVGRTLIHIETANLGDGTPCGTPICSLPKSKEALAALIAAAPDLLAFAQRALRIFLAWQHDANPDGDLQPGESADFDAATLNVEAARAALAKAEGRG
jgi:hypothetical protein